VVRVVASRRHSRARVPRRRCALSRPGPQLGPRERLRLAALIRAAYEADPCATIDDVRVATGASTNVVMLTRRRLVAEGKVAPTSGVMARP
jgi:hypothetical protein